jgi:hypothetical protein
LAIYQELIFVGNKSDNTQGHTQQVDYYTGDGNPKEEIKYFY